MVSERGCGAGGGPTAMAAVEGEWEGLELGHKQCEGRICPTAQVCGEES